jgi:hypothetical protein
VFSKAYIHFCQRMVLDSRFWDIPTDRTTLPFILESFRVNVPQTYYQHRLCSVTIKTDPSVFETDRPSNNITQDTVTDMKPLSYYSLNCVSFRQVVTLKNDSPQVLIIYGHLFVPNPGVLSSFRCEPSVSFFLQI